MTPRRIAYVLNIFPKISETFIASEIAELRRRGVEVRILSLLPPREEPRHEIVVKAGLDEITCYEESAFGEVIREFQPDLIHAHFAKEATEKARELSAAFGIPYSFTAHGYDIFRKPPSDFYKRAMEALAVITVSKSNAAYIHATFGVPKTQIHVISCGIDTTFFRPPANKDIQNGLPLLVCVARFVEVKNLSLLLQSCAILRSRCIRFRCVLAGDGPLRSQLIQQRAELGLEHVVELPGAVTQDQVLAYWQQATVGMLTSHSEGMPLCLMEAAACGVPVVATEVGGIPELVINGVTGLLCKTKDPPEFADAIELLLGDKELRDRMGCAARERAEQHFSLERQVNQLQRVWTEAPAQVSV